MLQISSKIRQFSAVFCLIFTFCNSYADNALLKQKDVQVFINKMSQKHHMDKQQLRSVMKAAVFQPQIIDSMNKPYEKKTWDVYKKIFLTPQRLQAGLDYWRQNQNTLAKAEKLYGVPAPIIVAIIGVETLYGKHQGNYRVLDALTTLAFHYPSRQAFFTSELEAYLLLCKEQHVSPTSFTGSYAGAIGKPQFMPSSYRHFAVDFTGNGRRDLINDDHDVIGSVANYFHVHKWQKNQPVGQPVSIHGYGYRKLPINAKKPTNTVKQLTTAGIQTLNRPPYSQHHRVGLMEFLTTNGQEYWMAYPNFYVIMRYNSSPQYALVVYLFAQQLAARKASGL